MKKFVVHFGNNEMRTIEAAKFRIDDRGVVGFYANLDEWSTPIAYFASVAYVELLSTDEKDPLATVDTHGNVTIVPVTTDPVNPTT